MICALSILPKIGLVLNIAGTLLVAFSFGKNLAGASQTDKRGRKVYLASYMRPLFFWWGIGLLVFGFALQLVF